MRNPSVDAYIAKSADFAHAGIVAVMAAFKRRLAETLALLAAGRTRYWKYQDC